MNRRYFLGLGTQIAAIGAALKYSFSAGAARAESQAQTGAQALSETLFEEGNRYYTSGGIFQVVDAADMAANGATVIDLSPQARQAILLPNEPIANVPALQADTRPSSWFTEGQGLLTRDGLAYTVAPADAEDAHIVTEGGTKLYVAGRRISVDAFGADPTGQADSTAAFNRALQFCVANNIPGSSSGRYRITGTLTPGGEYTWDWGSTVLDFSGAPRERLTEIRANPRGTRQPQPAGKYVLFDTKRCNASVNTGSLRIFGSFPGNMKLASRAVIPRNVVAISASEAGSADMTWGTLMLLGCDYGFWQGDQRGTSQNILPYTRWQVNYLRIQFCNRAMECGAFGNGLDDTFFSELRLTRNGGNSVLRGTDIGGGVAFINGLAPHADIEAQTAATQAGSPHVTLSGANPDIRVDTVIVIRDAVLNKAGGPCDLVARVTEKSGALLTLDRAAEVTQRGAEILCDPPSITLATTQWRFQQTYLEEIHDMPLRLTSRSAVYGLVKLSNGLMSSRYDCGILLVDRSLAKIVLHQTSSNNKKVKAVVGVASMHGDAGYNTNSADVTVLGQYAEATVQSDPLKIVALRPQDVHNNYAADASGDLNPNLTLTAHFLDGTQHYQRHGAVMGKPAFATGSAGMLDLGAPMTLAAADLSGDAVERRAHHMVKTPGAAGALFHPVTGGKRYRITVALAAFEAGAPEIRWHGAGDAAVREAVVARGPGRAILFADAPEDANEVRLFCRARDAYTVEDFTVAEVLSV